LPDRHPFIINRALGPHKRKTGLEGHIKENRALGPHKRKTKKINSLTMRHPEWDDGTSNP